MKKVVFLSKQINDYCHNDMSIALIYWYGVLEKFGYQVVYEDYDDCQSDIFYKSVKNYNPDFIIVINYFDNDLEYLNKFKEFTKIILLTSDIYRFYDSHVVKQLPNVDLVIHNETEQPSHEKLIEMKWAFNPNTMTSNFKSERLYNIVHYGGLHGDRRNQLSNLNYTQASGNYEQIKSALLSSKYSICFTDNATCTRKELKGRVVEIPNHTVLLTEPAPGLENYFNDDEVIIFNSIEEVKEKIAYYNSNHAAYTKLLDKGRKAIWSRNTCYHDWNKILHLIDDDYTQIDVTKLLKTHHKDYYYE